MDFGMSNNERLILRMTNEEKGYFSSLLEMADKNMTGKLEGKVAANFLKKSGLPKEILKNIWLIAAQTNPNFLEKDEFYIALRLVALAQNGMECSKEAIRLNHPIPPLPKFDLKNASSSIATSTTGQSFASSVAQQNPQMNINISGFTILPEQSAQYENLFKSQKDGDESISILKAKQIWLSSGVSNDTVNQAIMLLPNGDTLESLNNRQFHVCTHLIFNSLKLPIPSVLPSALIEYLGTSQSHTEPVEESQEKGATNPQNNVNVVESVLFRDFKMKPIVHVDRKSNMAHYRGVSDVGLIAGTKNLYEQLKLMKEDAEEENKFLTRELDDNVKLLNSFIDDIEKMNRLIANTDQKAKSIKDEIVEYRRKINIENDEMVKISMNMKMIQDDIKKN